MFLEKLLTKTMFFVKYQAFQLLGPFLNIYKFRFIQYFNFYSISGGASYFFILLGFWGFGVSLLPLEMISYMKKDTYNPKTK